MMRLFLAYPSAQYFVYTSSSTHYPCKSETPLASSFLGVAISAAVKRNDKQGQLSFSRA